MWWQTQCSLPSRGKPSRTRTRGLNHDHRPNHGANSRLNSALDLRLCFSLSLDPSSRPSFE